MRQPNAIDFWRGYALISIFVNHIPGNFFERFTYRNLTLSDSAELFVFLAGWAMRLSIENPKRPMTTSAVVYKLWGRAFTIYVAQTFITEVAIFVLAAGSVVFDAPFLLDWHNVGAIFHQPVEAHVGLVMLTYQLGYFNILPLYVVLMVAAPAVAILYRAAPALVLPLSVGLYALTQALSWNIPSWPVQGTWFFSPSAWQLIYVLGFLLAGRQTDLGLFARRNIRVIRLVSVPVLAVGLAFASVRYFPNLFQLPASPYLRLFDKTSCRRIGRCRSWRSSRSAAGSSLRSTVGFPPAAVFFRCSAATACRCSAPVAVKPVRTDHPLSIRRAGCDRRGFVYRRRRPDGARRMDGGMAYPHHDRRRPRIGAGRCHGRRAGSLLVAGFLTVAAGVARAEETPATVASPPALSASCEAPAADIAANAPLPNVAEALAEHKTLEILAVGSAALTRSA